MEKLKKFMPIMGIKENYVLDLTDPKNPKLCNLDFKDKDGNPRVIKGTETGLSVEKDLGGYIQHYIKDVDNKRMFCFLHQLIWAVKDGKSIQEIKSDEREIHHKNRCRWDNSEDNIAVVTHQENMNDPLTKEAERLHKQKSILLLNKRGSIKSYFSNVEEVKAYLIQQGVISLCKKSICRHCNKQIAVKGLLFIYTKDFVTALLENKELSCEKKIKILRKLDGYLSDYEKKKITDLKRLRKNLSLFREEER